MDEIILALQSLLTTALGSSYTIIYGEVKTPNESLFPLIEVIPLETNFEGRGTGRLSSNQFTIQINYKNTLKKFVDSNTNQTVIKHIQDAVKIMEERDSSTKLPKSTTILGCLWDNLKISNKVDISRDFQISYNVNEYGGTWVVKASLVFNATQITPLNC